MATLRAVCFWHCFFYYRGMLRTKRIHKVLKLAPLRARGLNSVLAYAASMMLTGVPPEVCETVISDLYCSVKKSLGTILH